MKTLFVANRGEIAARIIATASDLGYLCVVASPEVDEGMPYVARADVVVDLASPRDFADVDVMVATAIESGADLVHPGYGFLSENAEFARRITEAGLTFVGPSADVIALMGDKANARERAVAAGLSVPAGSLGPVTNADDAHAVADAAGFPLMVKAVAGGGGIGMAVAHDAAGLDRALESVTSRAASVFGDDRIIVEQFIERSRHVEVQVMGLPDGSVVALAERDCSVQRRHQKVVEESPSPAVSPALRATLRDEARRLAEDVGYVGAGTVEFILDTDTGRAFFLEMNTRLQVEHPVTEAVHSVDLVAWQLAIAAGSSALPEGFVAEPAGHAIELRVYAEDPVRFLPRPGAVTRWDLPSGDGIRVDAGYAEGTTVTPFFDPLLAKITVTGRTRDEAVARARKAVAATAIEGPGVNLPFLARVLDDPGFASGDYGTGIVATMTVSA